MFSEFVCFSSLSCRLLSGEFFPLLCSLAWLAVDFFPSGLLCTAELRFSDQFFGPCSHVVGMCSCKAKRFVEALGSSWIFTFAPFLFASALFRSGLLCTAELRFSDRFFGPSSHVVGMCSCKARRFVEALRSSWIFTFALIFVCFRFFLVWFALHRRAAVFGPVFWSVFPRRGNVFLQSRKVRWSFALFLDFHFCSFFVCFRLFWSGLLCTHAQLGFHTSGLVQKIWDSTQECHSPSMFR